jgi:hypothetical protein
MYRTFLVFVSLVFQSSANAIVMVGEKEWRNSLEDPFLQKRRVSTAME